jgi:hypothetical protein
MVVARCLADVGAVVLDGREVHAEHGGGAIDLATQQQGR